MVLWRVRRERREERSEEAKDEGWRLGAKRRRLRRAQGGEATKTTNTPATSKNDVMNTPPYWWCEKRSDEALRTLRLLILLPS